MNSDVALVCFSEKQEADILSFCRSYLESLANYQFMSLICGYRFFRRVSIKYVFFLYGNEKKKLTVL